ncbi:MAG: universal stress protein [Nitrospirae bacterium]|nr:universal stress protein [Nitrospirota bacterium]
MKHILVIDDEKRRKGLLSALNFWRRLTGAEVVFLSIIDESLIRDTTRTIGAIGKLSTAVSTEFVRQRRVELEEMLWDMKIDIKVGTPIEEIKKYLDSFRPDLLILSHAIKTGVLNITDEIIGYCRGNSYLITENSDNQKDFRNILLVLEQLKVDSAVVHTTISLAGHFNGRVTAIRIIDLNDQMLINAPEMIEEGYTRIKEFFSKLTDYFYEKGIPVDTVIKEGDFTSVLGNFVASKGHDLIVIEGYSRTGLGRIIMGNEVTNIIKKANRPILIIKRPFDLSHKI